MSRYRDFSLRVKLLLGFGAVLLVTGILGGVSIMQLGSVKAGGDKIASDALPSVQARAIAALS